MGLIAGVEPERPEAPKPHARAIAHGVPRLSQSVETEDTRGVRAAGKGRIGSALADVENGQYVDPDGPLLPPTKLDGSAIAVGDFQDPEYDLPSPAPQAAISESGEYVDPGDAP